MGGHALVLGVLAVAAGIAAFGLWRARSPITAASQFLAAAVLAFFALAIGFPTSSGAQPVPAPSVTADYPGPGAGVCRSGGTNEECIRSGG